MCVLHETIVTHDCDAAGEEETEEGDDAEYEEVLRTDVSSVLSLSALIPQ